MFERTVSAVLAAATTAALFACIPAVQQTAEEPETVSENGTSPFTRAAPVSATGDVIGEWDIVSFDGYEPGRTFGATRAAFADFGATGVALRIECNYSGARGIIRDGRFVSQPDDGVRTAMGCSDEAMAREAALFDFFSQDPAVEKLPNGQIRLVAGGTELLLERPAQRRLAFLPKPQEILGEWRLVEIVRYYDGGGYGGGGLSEVPGRISFDGITAGYTRCPRYDLTYRYTEDGRISKIDGPTLPDRPSNCEPLAATGHSAEMPTPWNVLTVLHDDPWLEKVEDDTLLMATERYGVVLTRKPCEMLEQSDDHSETRMVDCASPR